MYTNEGYLCRAERATRVYKSPRDLRPAPGVYLVAGVAFETDSMFTSGTMQFLRIFRAATEGTVVPVGYWVPKTSVDYIEISPADESSLTEPSIDGSSECNEYLYIKTNNVVVYSSVNSTTPVINGLTTGNVVKVDREINVNNNGIGETRYRIASVSGEESDQSLLGYWILGDYSVTRNGTTVTYDNPAVMPIAAPDGGTADGGPTGDESGSYNYAADGGLTGETNDSETAAGSQDIQEIDLASEALYEMYGFNYAYNTASSLMSVPVGRMLFVHGMPFQYTYITDRRNGSTGTYGYISEGEMPNNSGNQDMYGRIFAKEIACNMPIAVIVPGVPVFLTSVGVGSSRSARDTWLPLFSDLTDNEQDDITQSLREQGGDYDYYSMEIDTTSYFEYVNALCQTSAKLMGLTSMTYQGKKCTSFDWGTYNSAIDQDYNMFEEIIGLDGGVSFAFDPLSSITDSITNSVGQSQFADMLNQIGSKARELDFIAGEGAGIELGLGDVDAYEASLPTMSDGWLSSVTNPLSRIASMLTNSAKGMNVRFPAIWQDSQSSKSYSLDMKFITPYCTTFCKWRYVLVPFLHIFCLGAPRTASNTAINYSRPFLVRAFSKGYFNVEMGIISSIQWKRFGDGDMISEDGVPTEIDVTIEFEDLYQQLAMSKLGDLTDHSISVFFNNTGLMDLLGTLSGVNMNRITLGERAALWASAAGSVFSSTGSNFMRHINDRVRNITESFLYGI